MHRRIRNSVTYDFSRGWALGSHSGPLSAAGVDASGWEPLPLLGDSASRDGEAAFLPTFRVRLVLLCFLLFVFRGGMVAGVFGFCVRSIATTEATPGLLDLLGGLFLWRLLRHGDHHLHQKRSGRFLRQWGWTMYPLHLLYPSLRSR